MLLLLMPLQRHPAAMAPHTAIAAATVYIKNT